MFNSEGALIFLTQKCTKRYVKICGSFGEIYRIVSDLWTSHQLTRPRPKYTYATQVL